MNLKHFQGVGIRLPKAKVPGYPLSPISAAGKTIVKVVPCPGVDSTQIRP